MKKVKIIIALAATILFTVSILASAADLSKENKELIAKLSSEKHEVRLEAAQKLGDNKCREAIDSLVKILKSDKQVSARIIAAHALYKIGDKKVLPVFKEQLKVDKNQTVKTVLEGIIKKMES